MSPISRNVYIDKLDETVNEYNNTCHSTIKMNPVDVNSSTYIDFFISIIIKLNHKIEVGDTVSILKYKHIFPAVYDPNWFEVLVLWTYVVEDLRKKRQIKKISFCKMSQFPEPYTHSKNEKKLSQISLIIHQNLTKKCNRCRYIKFSEKVDLANVKPHVDKAESTPVD